jgi:tRNA(Ile)-lysidine synthase TilS/MesJ
MCTTCGAARAVLRRPKTFDQLCRECFFAALEDEVHQTIVKHRLFKRGERVALAASGGKDSTVLAHIVTTLNRRHECAAAAALPCPQRSRPPALIAPPCRRCLFEPHKHMLHALGGDARRPVCDARSCPPPPPTRSYGLDLLLLSIDEGISGYRDDSLDTVKRNEATYGVPLHVFSYKDLYGWTMDEIVAAVGTRSNCTFCGVFRRQALDRGAALVAAHKVATGHNADDVAETVLLNVVRGDVARLGRCAAIVTGEEGAMPRVKPFKYTYEKEIVMYAYFKRLDYFSTECVYAPFAARGFAREFVKDLEVRRYRICPRRPGAAGEGEGV